MAEAIAARRKGCTVTVLDAAVPPADKACGEGLMPDALLALSHLGVHIDAADSFAFRGIRFLDRGATVDARFPVGSGRGVRRTALHRILAEHAEAAGVNLCWGAHPDLNALRYGWLVGADGENSLVRRWAGLDRRILDRRRFGFRRHYRIAPWTDSMELYWGERHQVYVTPVTADAVCVAAISRNPGLRLDNALRSFPDLARRLKTNAILSAERGAVTATRRLQAVWRDRVALIGDASGSVDAITGEGLCLAFRQAAALAEAIARGDLRQYAGAHRRIACGPEWMARLLVALGDHPAIRKAAFAGMAAHPEIFAKMLALHVGSLHETNPCTLPLPDGRLVWTSGGTRSRSGPDAGAVHVE